MGGGDKLPSQGERGRGCKGSVRMALLPAGMASFAWEFHVTDPFGNYVYNGAPPPCVMNAGRSVRLERTAHVPLAPPPAPYGHRGGGGAQPGGTH